MAHAGSVHVQRRGSSRRRTPPYFSALDQGSVAVDERDANIEDCDESRDSALRWKAAMRYADVAPPPMSTLPLSVEQHGRDRSTSTSSVRITSRSTTAMPSS